MGFLGYISNMGSFLNKIVVCSLSTSYRRSAIEILVLFGNISTDITDKSKVAGAGRWTLFDRVTTGTTSNPAHVGLRHTVYRATQHMLPLFVKDHADRSPSQYPMPYYRELHGITWMLHGTSQIESALLRMNRCAIRKPFITFHCLDASYYRLPRVMDRGDVLSRLSFC